MVFIITLVFVQPMFGPPKSQRTKVTSVTNSAANLKTVLMQKEKATGQFMRGRVVTTQFEAA